MFSTIPEKKKKIVVVLLSANAFKFVLVSNFVISLK